MADDHDPLLGATALNASGLELLDTAAGNAASSVLRLVLAHIELADITGMAGGFRYQLAALSLDQIVTELGRTQLTADAADVTNLQFDSEYVNISVPRVSCPSGLSYTGSHELYAPHASLEDVRIAIDNPIEFIRASRADQDPDTESQPLDLHFLDALQGQLDIDLAVDMTLPWVGRRRVTHYFRIPIKDGTIDYEELEDDVHWLEAAFLTIDLVGDRLVLARDLPLLPISRKTLLWWPLEPEDVPMADYRRVHVRNLLHWQLPENWKAAAQKRASTDKPDAGTEPAKKSKSRLTLHALAMKNVKLALHATRPAQLELSPMASLQFGDDDNPGLSNLAMEGEIRFRKEGDAAPVTTSLRGSADLIDVTLKDVDLGRSTISVDRLHIGGIEHFELFFSGFTLVRVELVIGRMAATNVRVQLTDKS